MNTTERVTYSAVLALVFLGMGLAFFDHDTFKHSYVVEDGPIEWLTVVALTIGCLLCFYRVLKLYAHRTKVFITMTSLLGLLLFFVAGEEISWGERLFDIQTPAWFQQHNAQEEMNFHNLRVGGKKINKPIFTYGLGVAMLTYLFVITPQYKKRPAFAHTIDQFAIPIARPHHVWSYVVLLLLVELLVFSSKRGELLEFGGVFLFLMNIAFPYNKHIYRSERPIDG